MAKRIPIHPKDETFDRLMKAACVALRKNATADLNKAKTEFAEADIKLFFNENTDTIRVLRKNASPIDFPVDKWAPKAT